MKGVISDDYNEFYEAIIGLILNFDTKGELLSDGDRNTIKTFQLGEHLINIKSFKKPNLINKIVYRFFRKSKAQRSYEYANKLISLGVGTPEPFAYFEDRSAITFGRSYYVSEHLSYDITFRELTDTLDFPDHENLLRAFTRFTCDLHEKGINFLDHSPGNTLIQTHNGKPKFYLVDLNRMRFEPMDFSTRMKNLSKLTIHESVVRIMSNEYAKCTGEDEARIFNTLWKETQDFQYRFYRKKRLKKTLKFWK